MATPVDSMTKFVEIYNMSSSDAETAVNDVKAEMEDDGFVCIKEEVVKLGIGPNNAPRAVLAMLFQRQALLVPGNGSIKLVKKEIGHADLDAAALTQTITFDAAIPLGSLVVGRAINLVAVFAGGAVSSCVADFGDDIDADGWFSAEDVFTGASLGMKSVPDTLGAYVSGASADLKAAARTPQVKFTTVGANVVACTAGLLVAYVWYVDQALGAAVP